MDGEEREPRERPAVNTNTRNNGLLSPPRNTSVSSDSSSESDSGGDYVPYSQRPDWSDVKPVPQNDGPNPVVAIAYSQHFRDTFDYFRAVLASNERSLRTLELTRDCAALNPSNYTIWYFRRLVIQELGSDLRAELDYIKSVIVDNAKNYQVWHHRKCIVENVKQQIVDKHSASGHTDLMEKELSDLVDEEKRFVALMIRQDSKNYHGWQHRQWVINDFKRFEGELEYTSELMDDDIRNNSAWNHRYYVIFNTTGFVGPVLESEIKFTLEKIVLAPNNESAWNYLRGIMASVGLNSDQSVNQLCDDLYRSLESHRSPHLLSFMIDSIDETLSKQTKPDNSVLDKGLNLCVQLSTKIDTIRKEYWDYIGRDLKSRFGSDD